MNDSEIRSAVLEHYGRSFGEPAGLEVLQDSRRTTPEFEIFEWDLADRGIWMYASIGHSLSAWRPAQHRTEVIFPLKKRSFDLAIRVIGAALTVPREGGREPGSGHTIALSEPLSPAGMRRLLLTKPWAEEEQFELLELPERIHLEFLMIVPIHEVEFQYLRTHGEDALWETFAEQEIDFPDVHRRPAKLPA